MGKAPSVSAFPKQTREIRFDPWAGESSPTETGPSVRD